MQNPAGSFIWYELTTSDVDAALAFYRAVVGWEAQDAGQPGMRYMILSAGGKGVGGMMTQPPEALANGAPLGWKGYIGVPDTDAAANAVQAAGGKVHYGPEDIPGVGRFASASDPQGAGFVLFRGNVDQPSEAFGPMSPGHCGWHELHTSDWERAFEFYSGQFGWRKDEAMDMGPMGTYQLFAPAEGSAFGGMMNSPNMTRPMWLYYFVVGDIDAAVGRVTANDGSVLFGPSEVPGGAWIVQATDPQGIMFALVGSRGVLSRSTGPC